VAALPRLKCPHRLEPHQIQGLDFIHIFPVIQWLVKKALETREEMTQEIRNRALLEFSKTGQTPADVAFRSRSLSTSSCACACSCLCVGVGVAHTALQCCAGRCDHHVGERVVQAAPPVQSARCRRCNRAEPCALDPSRVSGRHLFNAKQTCFR
jgi:hypothetical protein